MDYEKKYKEALGWMQSVYPTMTGSVKEDAEHYFPELAESEDEKIRKEIAEYIHRTTLVNFIGKCKKADAERWIAWLEKQVPVDKEKVLIGARKDVALSIINYLDNNSVGMCLSNMECEDIEDACVNSKWTKLYNYMKKKLEKQGDDNKEYWRGYREGKQEILDKYAELEKNGEQNPNPCDECINHNGYINCENGELREVEQKSADKLEPKIKVKYAGCEYNVLEVKDIAGVTYYGIEDEPNHIDYVKADNCKIISGGYGIKENGSPYPTKTAVFSEQKPDWSEEDEKNLAQCIEAIDACYKWDSMIDWLKSLRQRNKWKPSEEQMRALHDMNLTGNMSYAGQGQILIGLYNDLKKLK